MNVHQIIYMLQIDIQISQLFCGHVWMESFYTRSSEAVITIRTQSNNLNLHMGYFIQSKSCIRIVHGAKSKMPNGLHYDFIPEPNWLIYHREKLALLWYYVLPSYPDDQSYTEILTNMKSLFGHPNVSKNQ